MKFILLAMLATIPATILPMDKKQLLPIPYKTEAWNFNLSSGFFSSKQLEACDNHAKCGKKCIDCKFGQLDSKVLQPNLLPVEHNLVEHYTSIVANEASDTLYHFPGETLPSSYVGQEAFSFNEDYLNKFIRMDNGKPESPTSALGGFLHYAVHHNAPLMVQLLLKWGADVNNTNEATSKTPLMYTVYLCNEVPLPHSDPHGLPLEPDEIHLRENLSRKRSLDIIDILLQNNADPNITDMFGKTALQHALMNPRMNLDHKNAVIQKLLEHGSLIVSCFPSTFQLVFNAGLRTRLEKELRRREDTIKKSLIIRQVREKLIKKIIHIGSSQKGNVEPLLAANYIANRIITEGFALQPGDLKQTKFGEPLRKAIQSSFPPSHKEDKESRAVFD